jgi:hypothetical protein
LDNAETLLLTTTCDFFDERWTGRARACRHRGGRAEHTDASAVTSFAIADGSAVTDTSAITDASAVAIAVSSAVTDTVTSAVTYSSTYRYACAILDPGAAAHPTVERSRR